ncbi:MAG: class II aldolase/adducin family protein [Clostridiales bacterium]|nr:class II aldolase/adducin family protein [Clostridiales bacterium]
MDILNAKLEVIKAGERLVESGLIARTWGNVSCRVDADTFVITPSGKPYIGLTADDIVEVKIADLFWSGDVKPSSEKGVHAEVYKIHPEANFVIHTHQKAASAVSVLKTGVNAVFGESAEIIGDGVLIGSYGLPGTKKLKKGVIGALKESNSKAVIMAHHGALCFGKDSEEAFAVASELEKISLEYLFDGLRDKFDTVVSDIGGLCDCIVERLSACENTKPDGTLLYNSECDRNKGEITFTCVGNGEKAVMNLTTGESDAPVSAFARAHRDIYLSNPDFRNILHNADDEVTAVSIIGRKMKPRLDDFAQICGTRVKVAKSCEKIVKKIKGKNAVLVKNSGALCCGKNGGDAEAVDMIMSKSALAELASYIYTASKVINPIESILMRLIYLKKYSKQAEK